MDKNTIKNIESILDKTGGYSVTVFGDFCLDKYIYIDPERDEISLETGLAAYMADSKKLSPGGAGNVAANLISLGVKVKTVGIAALDGEGYELLGCLNALGADTSLMLRTDPSKTCTSTYLKPMRRQPDGSCKEMNRFDFRNFTPIDTETEEKLLENLKKAVKETDAVLICDQFVQRNLGAVTDRVRDGVAEIAAENPDKIFFVDSRAFTAEFKNCIIKCNNHEFVTTLCGESDALSDDFDYIAKKACELSCKNGKKLFVTLGEKGIMAVGGDSAEIIAACVVTGETDICGAGDATAAALVTGMLTGLCDRDAASLATAVSAITIKKIGCTGTASPEEIKKRINE